MDKSDQHPSTVVPWTTFTKVEEKDSGLPLPHTLNIRRLNGSTKTTVYKINDDELYTLVQKQPFNLPRKELCAYFVPSG